MASLNGDSFDTQLERLVGVYTGEGDDGSSANFWDGLVANGYTTSADDARRVLQMIGAYSDPRVPFTRGTPTRIQGVDTDHKRAIMRVTASIRRAIERAETGSSLRAKADSVRLDEIKVAVRLAAAAGIAADSIHEAVTAGLMGKGAAKRD